MTRNFDLSAKNYDLWYEQPDGRAIFNAELKCLRSLCPRLPGSWLEVGLGTGRFASSLKIETGIDPSIPMLRIAKERGIATCAARAEYLPFPNDSFDGVLLALSLCFIDHPHKALRECLRILHPGGRLLMGIIPVDSTWGSSYKKKKQEGHPIYASAHFFHVHEILSLLERTGLTVSKAASTLFWSPEEPPEVDLRIDTGIHSHAGFLALLCTRNARQPMGNCND